jgi:hypothetical protein
VEFPDYMSPDAVSIVDELVLHPFFKGIDWQALQQKRLPPPENENVGQKPEDDNQSFGRLLKEENKPCKSTKTYSKGFLNKFWGQVWLDLSAHSIQEKDSDF